MGVHVDGVDGVGQFRSDVQQSIGSKSGQVRTDRLGKIDDVDGVASAKIHHLDGAAVGTGFAHAGISVNGNVAKVAVGRDGDLVAVDVNTSSEDGLAGGEIDEKSSVVELVGDEELAVR